jgi:hypothetical protein
VGQLCRKGEIVGKFVGRGWRVDKEIFSAYLKFQAGEIRKDEYFDLKSSRNFSSGENKNIQSEISKEISVPKDLIKDFSSAKTLNDLINISGPKDSRVFIKSPLQTVSKTKEVFVGFAIIFVMAFISVSTLYSSYSNKSLSEIYSANGVSSVALAIQPVLDSVKDRAKNVALIFYGSLNQFALGVRNSFATFWNKDVYRVAKDDTGLPPSGVGQNGMVVVPENQIAKKDDKIQQIKKSFSDEVEIQEDDSGSSGVIKPVFKDKKSDEYLYVLVPVKEKEEQKI